MSIETGSDTKIANGVDRFQIPSGLKRSHSSDSESDLYNNRGNGGSDDLFQSKKTCSDNLDQQLRSQLDMLNSSNDYYLTNGDLIPPSLTSPKFEHGRPKVESEVAIWSDEEVRWPIFWSAFVILTYL